MVQDEADNDREENDAEAWRRREAILIHVLDDTLEDLQNPGAEQKAQS